MKSPVELLLGRHDFKVPPKVFICVCFVKDHRHTVGNLDPQAVKCIFICYAFAQKGYNSDMFSNIMICFRSVAGKKHDANVFRNTHT